MGNKSENWVKAQEEINEFKLSMERRYGMYITINIQSSKHPKIPYISLENLIKEIDEVLFEFHPTKIVLCKLFKHRDISSGINSRIRVYEVAVFRHIYCYIARSIGYSYSAIGRAIGKDHATVINACKSIERSFKTNYCQSQDKYKFVMSRIMEKYQADEKE